MAIQQRFEQAEARDVAGARPDTITLLRPLPERRPQSRTLRLHLLGSPRLAMARDAVVPRTRKTLALLTYLAVQGGRHPREHLADLLWPDAEVEDGRASLRTALSYVRQALGADADVFLATSREFVGLHPSAPLDLDVRRLARAQQLIRRRPAGFRLSPDARILRRLLEAALPLYRGPFLADLSVPDAPDFEAWVEGQRSHWRGVAAELLQCLATLQLQDGDSAAALTTLERWTAVDPDEEEVWRQLIELHLGCEDRAGARRAWQRYREVLTELDAPPGEELAVLGQRVDASPCVGQALAGTPSTGRTQAWSADWNRRAGLVAAFERARLGHPQVVVVDGTAETGKRGLVSQLSRTARAKGADVLVGRALDTVGDLPYAAVVDALRARLDEENAPDDLLSDLWLGELSRLLPELRERYPDLTVCLDDPSLARVRLFEAVARVGQALGARKPLVFLLDDVQWTDGETRDVLRYAMRRWTESGTPILIVLLVRGEARAADPALAGWLTALEHDTSLARA